MNKITRMSIQTVFILSLAATVSCGKLLDDMAIDITALRLQMTAILMPKPLPEIKISPTSNGVIDMGITLPEITAITTVTIQNVGDLPLNLDNITVGGPNSELFTVFFTPTATPLGRGEMTTFELHFNEKKLANDTYRCGSRVAVLSIEMKDGSLDSNQEVYAPFNVTAICVSNQTPQALMQVWHEATLKSSNDTDTVDPTRDYLIRFENVGTADLTLANITMSDTATYNMAVVTRAVPVPDGTPANELVIEPGDSITVKVEFTPAVAGITYQNLVTITYNDEVDTGLEFYLALSGKLDMILIPDIELCFGSTVLGSGDTHVFTNQLLNTVSDWHEFRVYNRDSGDLRIYSITLSDNNNFIYLGQEEDITVPAGEYAVFKVRYYPITTSTATPPHPATLTIESNDEDESGIVINLEGYYNVGQITLENESGTQMANGETYDYSGVVYITTDGSTSVSATRSFTITNNPDGVQDGDLIITGILLADPAPSDNFILGGTTSGTLHAGESMTFTVAYDPQTLGSHTAAVFINTNDPSNGSFVLNLTGHSLQPVIEITSDLGTGFGNMGADGNKTTTAGSQATGDHTFTITNSGGAALKINSITPAGDSGDFDITYPAGYTDLIGPGATTTFLVRFDPITTGGKAATLTIASNDPLAQEKVLSLSGTGVVPMITIDIDLAMMRCVWEYDGDDGGTWLEDFGGPGIELQWVFRAWEYQSGISGEYQSLGRLTGNETHVTMTSNGGNAGTGDYILAPPYMDSCSLTRPKLDSNGGIQILMSDADIDYQDYDLLSEVNLRIFNNDSSDRLYCYYNDGEEQTLDTAGNLKYYLPINAPDTLVFRTFRGPYGSGDGEVWIYFNFDINDVTSY
ncbi:MAG TPA: choice-of-anchor D domain-containing protein [Spirochaetota bacterium]|nr:choice-of-anchor D domain-containing protein [Spirochaetota bacterium]HOD15204.1 choice-of-anchor D domain-containing protein [Spirochaetota bacterium]HPN10909.1 choice-of-anchor D domain-containing protein [Spirochaetota bacterium]